MVNSAFTRRGGQELANHALARRVAERGRELIVVGHEADPELSLSGKVRFVAIPRPLDSEFLGERRIERAALAERVKLTGPVVFVGNAGNCPGASVSWFHFVHAMWAGTVLEGSSLRAQALVKLKKWDARRREVAAARNARLVVTNSLKTSRDVLEHLRVPEERIRCIWFGADRGVSARPAPEGSSDTLLFVGALGRDTRKGLDVALQALALVKKRGRPQVRLQVAGAGDSRPWRRMADQLGLGERVTFLEFVDPVQDLMRRADLLVSPVRYESYGLALQEALCAGLPVLIPQLTTGIAESLPEGGRDFLVRGLDPEAWADSIERVLANLVAARAAARRAGESLQRRSWTAFADEFIQLAEQSLEAH
jgi:glycosyltransferase involved in cell wall biosynthesis